ncbi:hypothetical protein LR69_04653 [Geobacillus sp. BCO2]|nr:hypothetical protein LR69_04653 [Geobacillus sp. BCO2]
MMDVQSRRQAWASRGTRRRRPQRLLQPGGLKRLDKQIDALPVDGLFRPRERRLGRCGNHPLAKQADVGGRLRPSFIRNHVEFDVQQLRRLPLQDGHHLLHGGCRIHPLNRQGIRGHEPADRFPFFVIPFGNDQFHVLTALAASVENEGAPPCKRRPPTPPFFRLHPRVD